jgi:hypothetical protein
MANSPEDDQICPITFQHILVPMMSVSGHIYEAEAITRWVNEHGTSPFTRQPIRPDQLISDETTPMIFDPIEELPEPNHSQLSTDNPAQPLASNRADPSRSNHAQPSQPSRPILTQPLAHRNSQQWWCICCATTIIVVILSLFLITRILGSVKAVTNSVGPQSNINQAPSTSSRFVLMEIYFEGLLETLFMFNIT